MTRTKLKTGIYIGALWASSLAVLGGYTAAQAQDMPHSYLVFFDFDKSDLTPEAVKIVDQAAANAAAGKVTKIEVTGYTDTVGSDAYNMRLSKRRAVSVEAELTKQGVSDGEIAIFAKGKHDLLVPTADGVKEPQNRRVQIVYTEMAPPPAPAPAAAAEAAATTATPPPVFGIWAQLEAGITGNADAPHSNINYGHLFTDKANQVILNSLLLTAEKPVDTATDYDVGFRLQGMYGTDARYTHFLGELDQSVKERTQFDIVEAWVGIHTPWIGAGGMDIKVGQMPTYLGEEVIDPSGNFFYSKSYIFNYGIYFKDTGIMAITHVNDMVDLYTGIDTGANTTFGDGDENGSWAFQGGIGLNGLFGGTTTVLALTHIGAEDVNDNHDYRYLSDIVITYKPSTVLTLVTELNYAYEEAFSASAWGIAEYVQYALSDTLALSGRAEVFDDHNNFFVGGFPGNRTYTQFQRGLPLDQPPIFSPAPTTYSEFTVGLSYKPAMPDGVQALTIRPEIRFDDALNGVKAYKDGTSTSQFTFGLDVILKI